MMNGRSEKSIDQDSFKLIVSINEISLTKSIGDGGTVKESDFSTSSTQFQEMFTVPSSSRYAIPLTEEKCLESRAETESEKILSVYSQAFWNNVAFNTPFPDDPIIDAMILNHCNLDRSFSTETKQLATTKRLGYFSCHIHADGKTQSYHPDKSSARYLNHNSTRMLNMNLLDGFSKSVNWGRVPPGEMHILRWFNENKNNFQLTDENNNSTVDFMCYAKLLRLIMETPYNFRDDWMIIAIKVRGTIIMDEMYTPNGKAFTEGQSYHQKASSYAGYKFEELITRRYDGVESPTYDKGNRDSFYIVSKANFKNQTILYADRIDCALNEIQLPENVDEIKVAQIKTRYGSFKPGYYHKTIFWQHRVIPWWIDYWLGNTDRIICGDKTRDFRIEKVTRMCGNNLPNERHGWSPRTCVSFLDLVLTFIKTMVTDELTPYRFYCDPNKGIVCQKINEPVRKYLPSWFINDQKTK